MNNATNYADRNTPVSASQPTVFVNHFGANGTFDVAPLLETLQLSGTDGMVRDLDAIMYDLGRFYLENTDNAHNRASEYIYTLRELRNAYSKGAGLMEFDR